VWAGHANAHHKCGSAGTTTHRLRPASSEPAIVFGVKGGNILPWSIAIDGDGAITAEGWLKPGSPRLTNPRDTLSALAKLADAERFWSMPTLTNCTGALPDIATQYITITSTSGTRTVSVHGGCVASFNQLAAALQNAVGAHR
jgi:hypothetical protein